MGRQLESHSNVAASTDYTESEDISFNDKAGGNVYFDSIDTNTVISFAVSPDESGNTFYPLKDASGNTITRPAEEGTSVPIPVEAFGARRLRVTTDVSLIQVKVTTKD